MTPLPLHIVFLPAWYPHKYDAMFGLFVRKHAEAAALQHHINVLYLYALNDTHAKTSIEHTQSGNLSEWYIYYPKSKNPLLYLWRFLYYFFKGMRLIRQQKKIDLLHVHILSRMGVLAYLYNRLYGTPYVITEHWSRYLPSVNNFKGFWRKRLTRLSVKHAKAMMPVSQNLARAMQNHHLKNANYKIVNNVVADVFFQTSLNYPNTTKIRAVHVSTFENKSKNISGILHNIAHIAKTRSDFELIMIGYGMDYDKMRTLAKKLNLLNSYVFFKGEIDENTVATEMSKSHFLIMYSHYENMPVVISEAMACGLPVVSSDVGGISEHLTKDKGILCPPNQDTAFCQAFEYMLEHYSNYNRNHIRDYAQINFSYEGVANHLSEIYNLSINH